MPADACSRADGVPVDGRSGPLGYILPTDLNRPLTVRPLAQLSRHRNLSTP